MTKLPLFLVIVISGTAAVFLAAWIVAGLWRRTKNRSVRAAGFLWAIQFLGLSDVPPLTPQEQVEQENREKKNRGAKDRA